MNKYNFWQGNKVKLRGIEPISNLLVEGTGRVVNIISEKGDDFESGCKL
jgi:hypothetical protein